MQAADSAISLTCVVESKLSPKGCTALIHRDFLRKENILEHLITEFNSAKIVITHH